MYRIKELVSFDLQKAEGSIFYDITIKAQSNFIDKRKFP